MNLKTEAAALVARAKRLNAIGRTASRDDLKALDTALSGKYPSWLAELVATMPLWGLELGWQAYEPSADADGMEWLELCDAKGIVSESVECYPGLAILPEGYVNVGSCTGGSGNPYFISIHDGGDPPLYRIFHDVSDDPSIILVEGRETVASSLSEFFHCAIPSPRSP